MPDFNPNEIGNINNNIFGFPVDVEDAKVIFIPVPWDVTVSYNAGAANGPAAIFEASFQVDLYDPFKESAWKPIMAMCPVSDDILEKNIFFKEHSGKVIDLLSQGKSINDSIEVQNALRIVNAGCSELNSWVKNKSKEFIEKGKFVAVIGGDHSVPLGLLQTLSEKYNEFGILHIDAHADLRDSYEGFEFSHASIMFNVLKIPQIKKLVQLGIRDYCMDENDTIQESEGKIVTFFDRDVKHSLFDGKSWQSICEKIIKELPQNIYISFDIDGLDPKLCPNTGTPVPGGLDTDQVFFLLEKIVLAGKKIIGFDLCEVSPGENQWDANVGARLLFRLANIMAKSNNI